MSSTPQATKIMVAVRMEGGGVPSAGQTARVHDAMVPVANRAGLVFASSLADADYLITITIAPDPLDPQKSHFVVTGVEPKHEARGSADDLAAARARLGELEQWGQSRSAPVYQ